MRHPVLAKSLRNRFVALSLLALPLFLGYGEQNSRADETRFAKLSAKACGIDFLPKWAPRNQYEALMLKTGFTGGGVCLGDYDGDGLVDVFLTRSHGGGRLYRNLGDFKFKDVTQVANLQRPNDWQTGAAFIDVNNDGRPDLITACFNASNRLFLNQGNGKFEDATESSHLGYSGASIKPVFADYDNDGDLDMYLVTNRLEPKEPTKIRYLGKPGSFSVGPEHDELAMVIDLPSGEQKFAKAGQYDRLYRNELIPRGNLEFTDVSKPSGLAGNYHGLDGCWWDADDDGDADLYITNDFTDPDQFYLNNGDGTFTDVTKTALPCTPWFAMGCDIGDFNNDGRFDLLAADMSGTSHYRQKIAMGSMDAVAWFLDTAEPRQYMRNSLYINTGTSRFVEAAQLAGLSSTDWTWSVKVADFDNDGREDIFFTNGFTRDYLNSDFNNKLKAAAKDKTGRSLAWYDAPKLEEQNHVFRNEGNLRFSDQSKSWGLDEVGIAFGAAVGDLDNDGDLDLIVSNFDEAPSVYRNESDPTNHCRIELLGRKSNRQGVGAIVKVTTSRGSQTRYQNPSGGFFSCDETTLHFGIGDETAIEDITVRWPSGSTQVVSGAKVNKVVRITETGSRVPRTVRESQRLFVESKILNGVTHNETPFNDFAIQPLLPNKMSQLGPGMACGDVNGDGRIDIFVGGAKGETGKLLLQNADRTFAIQSAFLEPHRDSEDMGCVMADFDGDNDLDLFVVSGGVEQRPGSPGYRDRLYENETENGVTRFTYKEDYLPDLRDSGGPAAVVDFDRDGDLDIFIGGRVVPGEYPVSPKSRLLANQNGRFVEVSSSALDDIGMVTSAIWSDMDDDGWLDLIITHDYGPIRVLRNNRGKLVDESEIRNTSKLLGWWNSIVGCDVDCDGDTDYVVGNLGRNTKYHPTEEKPQLLYYGSFETGGRQNIVEAKMGEDCLLPVRGRSCSSNAMPFLATKFETFHEFASASLQDIYTDSLLQKAKKVAATIADSGVLINNEGRFDFHPLPLESQFAPVFGIEVVQLNEDDFADLILVQNFLTPQRETGRMNGGLGCVLIGNEDGSFRFVPPTKSGLVIPEDAKSTLVVDLQGDGNLSLIVALNNGPLRVFDGLLKRQSNDRWKIGDTKSIQLRRGKSAKFERYLGSGYLSAGSSPYAQLPQPTRD